MKSQDWLWASDNHEASDKRPAFPNYRNVFSSDNGKNVLDHLRSQFLMRRIVPTASDSELWYVEGQRSVVAYIEEIIRQGTNNGNA